MTKNLLLFLLVIFIGITAYYFIHLGHYPVAIVNGSLITAKDLNDANTVATRYYISTLAGENLVEQALAIHTESDPTSPVIQQELRRATLQDLIDKSLISSELNNRIGRGLNSAVASRLNDVNADNEIVAEAAKLLYGLDFASFKEMVLVPQAERELLEGRLFLEQEKLDSWLASAEIAARVIILTPEFSWDKNKVVLRSQ